MTRYVRFINETSVEDAPMNFITPEGSVICNFNLSPEMMLEYNFKPLETAEREPGKEYTVTYKELKTKVKEIVTEVSEEEIARRERERLDKMTLTPSDVERALYYGLGMDFDDLKALIAVKAPTVDVKAIGIEFRANDFYRGAQDKQGNRLVDMIGLLLGLTTEDLDYLFKHKELPQEASERVKPIIQAMLHPEAVEPEPESTICFVCGNDPCTCNNEGGEATEVCEVCGNDPCTCEEEGGEEEPTEPEEENEEGTTEE